MTTAKMTVGQLSETAAVLAPSRPVLPAIARTGAGVVGVFCLAALAGWVFGLPALTGVVSGRVQMSVPTIVAFLLCAASVVQLSRPDFDGLHWVIRRRVCAGLTLALAVFTLIGAVFADRLGVAAHDLATGHIFGPNLGSVTPATALCFLLASLALLIVGLRGAGRAYALLAALGLIVTGVDLVGYAYNVEALYAASPFSAMSLPTALSFAVLFCAILLARPHDGWTARIVANDNGGRAARRLLPPVILIPILLGWLMVHANRSDIIDAALGFAIVAAVTAVVLGIVAYLVSVWFARRDAAMRAEVDLRIAAERKANAQLDRMNLLHQINRATGERLDLSSIFQVVLRRLEDQLPIAFGCICLYDATGQSLTVSDVGGKGDAVARRLGIAERTNIVIDPDGLSRCIAGELVYEPDTGRVDFPFPQRMARAGMRSQVIAPLIVERNVFGVLIAAREAVDAFSSTDCEFLRQLGEHVALAARQAELYGSLQRAYDDLRQTQAAIVRQERLRALGQMASGIAHDINNAISPVALYTESLLEIEPNLSERVRRYLGVVKRVIDDVGATVARMREFYRRDSEPAFAPVDLDIVVQQVVDLTRARWSDMPQQRGTVIELRTELAPRLPPLMGMESEIREALTNLIFNAVDAMPEGGTLTVRTREDPGAPGRTRLEIADTGTGMDETTRARCMEPFYTTKGERGTGLGLAMVYGMVERHGAELEIESAPGNGTAMRVIFPKSEMAPEQCAATAMAVVPSPHRILVVDDDEAVLDSMRYVLEMDGHAVALANGGKEGIDAFRQACDAGNPFSVVFTDLGMPYVDGNQVVQAIKALSPKTPVVLLTGWGKRMAKGRDTSAQVDHVLSKPPKLQELREVLARAAAQPTA